MDVPDPPLSQPEVPRAPDSGAVAARVEGPPIVRPELPLRSRWLFDFVTGLQAFFVVSLWGRVRRYFTSRNPTFGTAFGPFLFLTTLLYLRLPTTNYIFDEQEALLANPYVNQVGFKYQDAIYRDFWGLPPNASIGSYRPIPNYLWRGLVELGERAQPVATWIGAHQQIALGALSVVILLVIGLVCRGLRLRWLVLILFLCALALGVGGVLFLRADLPPVGPLTDVARRSFFQHIYNLFFHAVNGAIFTSMAWAITRRKLQAWLVGTTFVTCAVLTEAVSGCVGLADVLGGMGALCALASIGLPAYAMPFGVFLSVLFGLFSKESAVVCIPLVPFAALVAAPVIHPEKPARLPRAVLAAAGSLAAFVLYVEMRKRWFPSPLPSELSDPLPETATETKKLVRDFMVWFHQAPLPRDPLNNPFASNKVDGPHRVAGALRVYWRGLTQVVFPKTLSGDYSFPQEPAPDTLVFPESVLGAVFTIVPVVAAFVLWLVGLVFEGLGLRRGKSPDDGRESVAGPEPTRFRRIARRATRHLFEASLIVVSVLLVRHMLKIPDAKDAEDQLKKNIAIPMPFIIKWAPILAAACFGTGLLVEIAWKKRPRVGGLWRLSIVAVGLLWLVVSYFPHSNVPVLLPTVRAERLWYFPVIGTTMVVATLLDWLHEKLDRADYKRLAIAIPVVFLGFQAFRAYWHATDYRSDLVFWDATKDAVPNSAKAHLNYSVMVGAHNADYKTRLFHSYWAERLAPDWAMAHIYAGDTLCRMGQAENAWPHYAVGFEKGPADKGLISLALQCMWDKKILKPHDAELRALSEKNPGSWLAYLAIDTLDNGDGYGGVNPEYRPRSYNEGPSKKKTTASASDSSADSGSASESASDDASIEIVEDETASASSRPAKANPSHTTSAGATATHSSLE